MSSIVIIAQHSVGGTIQILELTAFHCPKKGSKTG
jgi:hypothetical protein